MSRPTFASGELWRSPTIPAMRNRLLLTLLLAVIVAIVAAPAQAATKRCDLTGDTHRADDCVTHSHVGATADGRMRPGDTIAIREHIADALRGDNLVTEVQVRRVSRDGTKGPWIGLRRTRWSAADTAAHATHTIDVCRAKISGRYEFRTSTRLPADRRTARQSGATATSAPTAVTLPNAALPNACPTSATDEMNIEYFNETSFSQQYAIVVADQGSTFALSLQCPPRISAEFPPPTLGIAMALEGAPDALVCNGASLALDKATLQANGYAGCTLQGGVPQCTFDFVGYSTRTQVVYSDTLLQISLTTGGETIIPNLNPATLPLCPTTITPCLLTNTCSATTSKVGSLSLCDSADAATCDPPPTSSTYSFNDIVYFQVGFSCPPTLVGIFSATEQFSCITQAAFNAILKQDGQAPA